MSVLTPIYELMDRVFPEGLQWQRRNLGPYWEIPLELRVVLSTDELEFEITNGGLPQFLWNTYYHWQRLIDDCGTGYEMMGAIPQKTAVEEFRPMLEKHERQCFQYIMKCVRENDFNYFRKWCEEASSTLQSQHEKLFYHSPQLDHLKEAWFDAHRAKLEPLISETAARLTPLKRTTPNRPRKLWLTRCDAGAESSKVNPKQEAVLLEPRSVKSNIHHNDTMSTMKIVSALVALGFAMLAATAAEHKTAPPEFVKLYAQWDEALVKSDVATLSKLYADEARLTSPEGKLETKEDFLGQVKSGEYKAANPSTTELQVHVYGGTAVVTCVWKADETIKGEKIAGHYRFTDAWVKRDGRWQVVASQGTPVKPQK